MYVVWVLVLYAVVQFVDNHYIKFQDRCSKVRINALMSTIVALAAGGAIWVLAVFLPIPLLTKNNLDRTPG